MINKWREQDLGFLIGNGDGQNLLRNEDQNEEDSLNKETKKFD